MYRFLLTARWLGLAAIMAALAAVMVGLGFWQLSRYHERSTVNARIDTASHAAPVPLPAIVPIGHPPAPDLAWTRVTVTGRYDPANEIIARDRTVNGGVGFEIVTPLVLGDGSAVLVDRGWLPPSGNGGALALPSIPPAPSGQVTLTGRVHVPESRPDTPIVADGLTQVRRISPARVADRVPHPLYGAYLLLDQQQPVPNDAAFTGIPSDHQNSAINAGYTVQWWAFALLTLLGYWWLARREAHAGEAGLDRDDPRDMDPRYLDVPEPAGRAGDAVAGGSTGDAPVSPAV